MDVLYYIILLPIAAGIVLFAFPESLKPIKAAIAIMVSAITLYFAYEIYLLETQTTGLSLSSGLGEKGTILHSILTGTNKYITFHIDSLSRVIALFTGIFGLLISLYSSVYVTRKKNILNYYPFYLVTLGSAMGAILADNLLLFIFFWGVLGFTLYKLIKGYDEESSAASKKTLILIGSSDGIMIAGIAMIWKISGNLNMSEVELTANCPFVTTAFLALLIGSFTKAGAFPFHTWIPDYSKNAPAVSSAYLPASLDKLLGIYFLARICVDMFILNEWLTFIIILLGVITIIIAVMMALIQHNFKKLLGYHAVSQVGYMVVGIGMGTPLGVAAGLFHMLNNALYKSGLFLSAGNVENKTGQSDFAGLGGLSKAMPITFFAALIFAFSISGIPPFNGFASKWMIYQGIIDFGNGTGIANQLWIVWLALAVLGSALTLASFIKFISGIFLGRKKEELAKVKEVNILMWLPILLLALTCIGFGIFAGNYVVPELFKGYTGDFQFVGVWQSTTVGILIILSIILGLLIYLIGNIKNFRTTDTFIGGETFREQTDFSVTEFYNTIKEIKPLTSIYKRAEKKWFDIYDLSKSLVLWLNNILSKIHTGVLTSYAMWIFAGIIIMMLYFL